MPTPAESLRVRRFENPQRALRCRYRARVATPLGNPAKQALGDARRPDDTKLGVVSQQSGEQLGSVPSLTLGGQSDGDPATDVRVRDAQRTRELAEQLERLARSLHLDELLGEKRRRTAGALARPMARPRTAKDRLGRLDIAPQHRGAREVPGAEHVVSLGGELSPAPLFRIGGLESLGEREERARGRLASETHEQPGESEVGLAIRRIFGETLRQLLESARASVGRGEHFGELQSRLPWAARSAARRRREGSTKRSLRRLEPTEPPFSLTESNERFGIRRDGCEPPLR